jgi:hypothetical protein
MIFSGLRGYDKGKHITAMWVLREDRLYRRHAAALPLVRVPSGKLALAVIRKWDAAQHSQDSV